MNDGTVATLIGTTPEVTDIQLLENGRIRLQIKIPASFITEIHPVRLKVSPSSTLSSDDDLKVDVHWCETDGDHNFHRFAAGNHSIDRTSLKP